MTPMGKVKRIIQSRWINVIRTNDTNGQGQQESYSADEYIYFILLILNTRDQLSSFDLFDHVRP